tara:strand:- start:1530 stop:1709 length:180 start_codon:yes stop_codon:yes gene_type:complete
MTQSIRNIAIIAHVDHGKTTLVDKINQECETLDIRKDTGGFNFQSAWTTGYLAGKNSVL